MEVHDLTDRTGWFAEWVPDDDPDYDARWPWRATLQRPGFVITTQGPWFRTKAECLDFIQNDIIGQGMFPER